jgi:hypothetical protein
MSSRPSKHRARLSLRLYPSLQPESPGQGTGVKRRFTFGANAPSIKTPAFGATAESGPVQLMCRVARDLGGSPFQPAANG